MKKPSSIQNPLLRVLLLAGIAIMFSACNREFTQEDFQVELVSIDNTATTANVELRVSGPKRAGDFTAIWTSGSDVLDGTTVTFSKQDGFDVQVVITPEEGSDLTLNATVDVRARLDAGGDGITDYRDAYLGNYTGTFRHDHYDDLNGSSFVGSGSSRVIVTKADASQPLNFLKLEYQYPAEVTQTAVDANGTGTWGTINSANFYPEVDSLRMTVKTGGNASFETYYHSVKR